MATLSFNSSPVLYRSCIEWSFNELREYLEISRSGITISKRSPEVEFTVPVKEGKTSPPIHWHIVIFSVGGEQEFHVYGAVRYDGLSVCINVGIKGSLTIFDETNRIGQKVSFTYLTNKAYNIDALFNWTFNHDCIPFSSSVKLVCTYVAYGVNYERSPPTSLTAVSLGPPKLVRDGNTREYTEEFTQSLNKDRIEGTTTDAVLKHGEVEYTIHKCVLSIHSEFFKSRFSDRWNLKDGAVHTVDMNDPDLTADIIEALLCSAYTGKVEGLEMALKLLPVTDKYQFKNLKSTCESIIGSQLKKENLLEMYVLAKQCDAQDLMAKCDSLVRC